MATFTIITVCYNSEATIEYTLESVLRQTFTDFDYVIMDGGSTDHTNSIITQFLPLFAKKNIYVDYISEPDSGIYNAMNKGIARAKGEYVGILNSDDTYESETLGLVYEKLTSRPKVDIFHGLMRYISHGKLSMIRGRDSRMLNSGMIEHPTCFVKRSVYEKYGNFDEQYQFVADYDFLLRVRAQGCSFQLMENVLANFNEDGAGNSYKSKVEALRVLRKYSLASNFSLIYKWIKISIREAVRRDKR